jgi:hypothetical protein
MPTIRVPSDDLAVAVAMEQRRQQLAQREVAGAAEDHQVERRQWRETVQRMGRRAT